MNAALVGVLKPTIQFSVSLAGYQEVIMNQSTPSLTADRLRRRSSVKVHSSSLKLNKFQCMKQYNLIHVTHEQDE